MQPLEPTRLILGWHDFVPGKVYTFVCPVCRAEFTYDKPGEPLCTGPSPARSDHDGAIMRLKSVVNHAKVEKNLDPVLADQRAKGPLWVPRSK